MVWKLLSAIAIAALLGAGYFSFVSRSDIPNEKHAVESAQKKLNDAEAKLKEAGEKLTQKQEQEKSITAELEKAKAAAEAAKAQVQEKKAALDLAKKDLEQKGVLLTALEKKIEEAGDIKKLLAQVESLKKDREAAELETNTKNQAIAQAAEELATVQKSIESNREVEARSRRGELDPAFTARVAQSFGDWGFAVISKGNNDGIVANADLQVKRGETVVATLKVRNVEPGLSVADVVPGTLASGEVIRTGDVVVAAPVTKKEAPKPAATPAAGAAPAAAPAAPATPADPFAAAPAGAPAAPMAADPFAAAAPAAGAPAAAPAAPAAPAAADPFAPAPAAPAAGGTPAAGTPQAPSTADPFAK